MARKVEIIDIQLNIDVEDEINKKIAELSDDIKTQTQEVLERAKARQQRVGKKKREQQAHADRMSQAVQMLETVATTDDPWLEGGKLLTAIGIEPTAANLSKFALQMRKFLKNEDKWALLNKRMSRKTYYRLERFG